MYATTVLGFLLISMVSATRSSVIYEKSKDVYRVTSGYMRGAVAEIWYDDEIEKNGWGTIKIVTNPSYADEIQAFSAGFAEGFVAYERIYQHVSNILAINFKGFHIPKGIDSYLKKQINFLYKMIENPPASEKQYWYSVRLLLKQLEGLTAGYNMAAPADHQLTFQDLYMHNADGDMETLLDIFHPEGYNKQEWLDMLECSALVRMTERGDIMMGHATWRNFAAMLRHYKLYEFHYHSGIVRLSFSASPGFINSKDDFYVNGHGIGSMETTNGIYDESLYVHCIPETVPSFIRSQVSNMLAEDPKTWVDLFEMYNSGTYNNQWMAVDLNGFGKKENIMWIVEQIPGLTIKEDVTRFLLNDGYWGSYNIPYIREIYEKSGYTKQPATPDIDYYNCSRHNIFKRDAKNVISMDDFLKIMRYNNYKNEPLAEGNPKHTIASRYDLFEEKPRHFGGIDSKVTSTSLNNKNMGVFIASGPSFDGCEPFSWSKWMKDHEAVQHIGHPDVFNFDYVFRNFD